MRFRVKIKISQEKSVILFREPKYSKLKLTTIQIEIVQDFRVYAPIAYADEI